MNEKRWEQNYKDVCVYLSEHSFGLSEIPEDERGQSGTLLHRWVMDMWKAYNNRSKFRLNDEQREKLEALGIAQITTKTHKIWLSHLMNLKRYVDETQSFQIPNGYTDTDGTDLSSWLKMQRAEYCRGEMNSERIAAFREAGLFDLIEAPFEKAYRHAEEYYKQNGDLNVPSNCISADGFALGRWITNMRDHVKRDRIPVDYIPLLDKIGMVWDARKYSWMQSYEICKRYFDEHGNLDFPDDMSGCNGQNFTNWLARCRLQYRKHDIYELIGKPHEETMPQNWQARCLELKKFYDANGHTTLPDNMESANGINMRKWLTAQRRKLASGGFSEEEIAFLRENGIYELIEEPHEASRPKKEPQQKLKERYIYDVRWEENVLRLKQFYDMYHHTQIPKDISGENGSPLATWFAMQRSKLKHGRISDERIAFLRELNILELFENPIISDDSRSDPERERVWQEKRRQLKAYCDKHHTRNVPATVLTAAGTSQRHWYDVQKTKYRSGKLSQSRLEFLYAHNMINLFQRDENETIGIHLGLSSDSYYKLSQIAKCNKCRNKSSAIEMLIEFYEKNH
ncbi:MAG: helicase associated domain-containing protein [Ruminococcus flavefaciens]|nr:helicase associated domain-containing protein [Ruminococcus flavefaciens]